MSRRAGGVLAALLLLGLLASLVRPRPDHGRALDLTGRAERVVVVALPGVRWGDVDVERTPALHAFAETAGIGLLSPQTAAAAPGWDDRYATLGAGSRAVGSDRAVALEGDEAVEAGTAAAVYSATTGRSVAGAALVVPDIGALHRANHGLPYPGGPGALSEAVLASGRGVAVLAAADAVEADGSIEPVRQAALALVDAEGRIGHGASRSLLVPDPLGVDGLRYDDGAVLDGLDDVWDDTSVVLIEASGLRRAEAEASVATPAVASERRVEALRDADRLVAGVQARADDRTAVVVVAPGADDAELTVLALAVPGVESGLLRSASTRRAGHALLVDVAPTVLALLDVPRPSGMEGRPVEILVGAGDLDARRSGLLAVEAGAEQRDALIGVVATAWIVVQVLVLVGAIVAWRRRPGWRQPVLRAGLALLLFVPVSFAAAALPLHDVGAAAYVVGTAVVSALLAMAVERLVGDPVDAVRVALGCVVGVLVLDVVVGAPLQLNAVFGYTPTVAGRFAGVGNLAFALLAPAALLLAALWARPPGAAIPSAAVAVLAVVVVVDGLPAWGSDVGGVLSLVPAAGLLVLLLRGRHPRPLGWLVLGVVAVALLGGFLLADLARPEAERTHLARLAESVDADGVDAFLSVARRKLEANVSVLTSGAVLLVPLVLAAAGWAFWRGAGPYGELHRVVPGIREGLAAVLVLAALGFALNDSGIAVPAVAYGILNASLAALVVAAVPGADPQPPVERT